MTTSTIETKGMLVPARRRVAAVAVALALTVSACGSGGGDDGEKRSRADLSSKADYNPQPRDNVEDGGTFTTAIGEIPENLNQLHADNGGDGAVPSRWYNPQLKLISDTGEVTPNPDYLADVKSELVDGNRVVTYTINDKAVYNDGSPIDWRSFEARWKIANGENEEYAVATTEGYSLITSVEKGETDKQAVVTYDGPWVWWNSQFPTLIHPDAATDPDTFNTAYLGDAHNEWGAGPYQLTNFDPNATSLVFERNPSWWGEPGKLDQRIFRVMEPTAAINAFRNGELDAAVAETKENLAQIEGMDGVEIRQSAGLSTEFFHINAKSPKLEDVNVRKAVALALDRDQLQKVRYNGMGWDEELPGSINLYPFQENYRDNYTEAGGGLDVDQANSLLDDAGWAKGDDGVRTKDGARLELVYPVIGDDPTDDNFAKVVQQMLKGIGVDVKIDPRGADEFTDTYTNQDYDIFNLGWGTADPDEGFFYFCYFYCSDAGYVDDATIDEFAPKAKELGNIADREKAIDAFMDLELDIYKTFQIVPIYNGPEIWAVKEGIANTNQRADLFHFGPAEDIGWQK